MFAYVDEAYHLATRSYVIGAVIAAIGDLPLIRASALTEPLLPPAPKRGRFKWRDAKPHRRRAFLQATVANHNLNAFGIVKHQVDASQQEAAREACLGRLVAEGLGLGVTEFVLDRRNSPGKIYLDNRTFGRLVNAGSMPAAITYRFAYPSNEAMLLIADAVSGATYAAVGGEDQYVQIIDTNLVRRAVT
jgi:hypothetical protein